MRILIIGRRASGKTTLANKLKGPEITIHDDYDGKSEIFGDNIIVCVHHPNLLKKDELNTFEKVYVVDGRDYTKWINQEKILYSQTRPTQTPILYPEVIKVEYTKQIQKINPKALIIYSVQSVPPIDFKLFGWNQELGISEHGTLLLTQDGQLNDTGKIYSKLSDLESKELINLGVKHCGTQIYNDCQIQFTDPKICDNNENVYLIIQSYNVWVEKEEYPFGKIGGWKYK